MNATATIGDTEFASPDSPEPCHFVVLCDGADSHTIAMEICERLMLQFDDELLFALHSWTLREISPDLSEQVTSALARADVIIFAIRGEDLPYPARRCLELSAEQRCKSDGALGLLLVEPRSPSAAIGTVLSRLEYAAARLHMDFLPMLSNGGGAGGAPDYHAGAVTSLLKGLIEQPPSHWGLNE